jgi:type III secretory pathway component EscT
LGTLADAFDGADINLAALGLAWARAMPAVTLGPAFGQRAVMGLALAASIFPALTPVAASTSEPFVVLALIEVARGLPLAIAAAVPLWLWAATMAGGVADALRGSQETPGAPTVEGRATPLGVLLSLLACGHLPHHRPVRPALRLPWRVTL